MTTTITSHQKYGIHIPAPFLKEAGMPTNRKYVIKINTPIINIIPQKYEEEEGKDWFDEALETEDGKAYFRELVQEAEKEYHEGKTRPIEELFQELGV